MGRRGGVGEFMASRFNVPAGLRRLWLQFAHAGGRLGFVEGCGTCGGGGERTLVILQGRLGLMQLIEAHRQVELVVGVIRHGRIRLEVGLLRFAPLSLRGVQIAQGELRRMRVGLRGQ